MFPSGTLLWPASQEEILGRLSLGGTLLWSGDAQPGPCEKRRVQVSHEPLSKVSVSERSTQYRQELHTLMRAAASVAAIALTPLQPERKRCKRAQSLALPDKSLLAVLHSFPGSLCPQRPRKSDSETPAPPPQLREFR